MKILPAQIFPDFPEDLPLLNIVQRQAAAPHVRICAGGDMSFSGKVATVLEEPGANPFSEISPLLRSSDIVFANLESTIRTGNEQLSMFTSPKSCLDILKNAGFSILHLANNHIYDHGPEGLAATIMALRRCGIVPLGAGETAEGSRRLVRTDANGLRIGWLGCGRTHVMQQDHGSHFWEFDEKSILEATRSAAKEVDILVLSLHKGFMDVDFPAPEDKILSEKLIGAGADLVLMHHAHVLQGIQSLHGEGLVCFSLGNLLFDSSEGYITPSGRQQEQDSSAIFVFDFDREGLAAAFLLPIFVDQDQMIRFATGARGREILQRVIQISECLSDNYAERFIEQRVERNFSHGVRMLSYHATRGHFKIVWDILRCARPKHFALLCRWLLQRIARMKKHPLMTSGR
ncbi:CapA family protein [candidate division KSB1 bacterium]|nr:CapA family protein [candidate division KSB1 bacterium]